MTTITGLLELRESLKEQLSQVEAALGVLDCSYCHMLMECSGEPIVTFVDGVDYSIIRSGTEYKCPRCGQSVEICEESENEKCDGEWREISHRVWANVRQPGEPFIFQ